MTRILRRTFTSGAVSSVRRGIRRLFREHARLLSIAVVVSLLLSSLPVSTSTQGVYLETTPRSPQSQSFAVQLYSTVTNSVTSIGSWMASFIATEPSSPSSNYQPVAAYLTPAPPFIDAPASLQVTAASSSSINLSWTAPSGIIDHYVLERSEHINGPFTFVANVVGATTKNDTTVTNLRAYLYRVRAVSNTGAVSSPSNMALGTAISFQFQELDGQQIRAQHFHDVRTAINLVRTLANLGTESWDRANLLGLTVDANDVNEMRTALNAALTALAIPVTAYEDPTLSVGATGTLIKAIHIEQLQTRSTRGSSTSSGPIDSDSSTARLDPLNATGGGGENPLSRNFNWNLPLVSLTGRAGLSLDLTLSYNSLVWTKIGSNAISFDEDNGFPGPGFRLGFPVIQQRYFNSEVGKQAYLLITPDGSRVELRQVGSSTFYEAADSSHLMLDEFTMILRTTDGTQLTYAAHGGEFKCTEIKDRNGNFISVSYTLEGHINTVTDTLNRVITFNYINGRLDKITQVWKQGSPAPVTHNWARFEYADKSIDTDFSGLTVFGPPDTTNIKTLTKVTLADNSRFEFTYTSWGQVWKVTRVAADNSVLDYRTYDLPQTDSVPHTDCPRFTVRKDWGRYANGDTDGTISGTEEATTATFIVPVSDNWTMPDNTPASGVRTQVTSADGTLNKIYFAGTAGTDSGWKRGLPALVETHSGGAWKRKVMTTWTQDDDTESFILNPRVTETNVYDPEGNRARKEITYQSFSLGNDMSCHLPQDVFEYAANASTKLRSTRTLYNMTATYTSRRILGLVREKLVYEGDVTGTLMSKSEFFYDNDNGSSSIQGTDAPVGHDNTDYTASFVAGRGNPSSTKRYDVTNLSQYTTTRTKYNTAGAVVSLKDALDHETTISYADSFSDGTPRNTLAYPTTITDPDSFVSTAKFNFDFGAVTSMRTPKPNESINVAEAQRPEQVFTYDSIGRLEQITNSVNAASTRFEYSTAGNRIDTFIKVEQSLAEAHSWEITDGFRRVVATAKDHTATTFSGQKLVYDSMGRVFKTFNPTETTASGHPSGWSAVGDDANVGWLYIEQTYDWKSRPLVTTNQDGTTRTNTYSGCGCAGGEVVTMTDEGTIDPVDNVTPRKRQKKIYSDVLGRNIKAEVLNWEGGSVHSAVVNTFNARDQITQTRQFAGAAPSDPGDLSCPSGTCQKSETTYDGFGRQKTSHAPEQQQDLTNNPASTDHTTWDYNADDTIQKITDPRGAVSTFSYNNRRLVTNVTYTLLPNVPTTGAYGVTAASTVSFQYDAVGNRKLMNDGMGSVTYNYDSLSQLTSETRFFSSLSGSSTGGNYSLSYEYNLANQVTRVTDPNNVQVHYGYDHIGRLSGVTGTGFTNVSTFLSNIQYRAWGAPKSVAHVNNRTTETTYDARLRVETYKLLPASPDDGIKLHNDYDYFPDGRLKKLTDLDDHDPTIIGSTDTGRWFSRVYRYDHLGRISRARGYNQPNNFEFDRPYDLSYGYDSFNHLTSRSGKYYYQTGFSDSGTFTNNRRNGWDYGADGRETRSTGPGIVRDHTYNAAGQVVQIKETVTATSQISTFVTSYDGDGNQAREFLQQDQANTTSYKVRSTVLKEVVTRLNNAGNKTGTTVHLDKQVTPTRINSTDTGNVPFPTYDDPLGQSIAGDKKAVYDPLGNHVLWQSSPQSNPPPFYPRSSASFGSLGSLWGNAQESSCQLDGIPTNCDLALSLLNNGSAMQCRDNDCGPRFVRTTNIFGDPISQVSLPYMAFGDGSHGSFFGGWSETPQEQAAALFAPVSLIDGPRPSTAYNFAPPQGNSRRRTSRAAVTNALKTCLTEIFGSVVKLDSFNPSSRGNNGSTTFTYNAPGSGVPIQATVHNDVTTFNGAALDTIHNLSRGRRGQTVTNNRHVNGITLSPRTMEFNGRTYNFDYYTNYTASDANHMTGYFPGLDSKVGAFQSTQFHELGNSISSILTGDMNRYGDSNDSFDKDSGQQLEKCMANKLSGGG